PRQLADDGVRECRARFPAGEDRCRGGLSVRQGPESEDHVPGERSEGQPALRGRRTSVFVLNLLSGGTTRVTVYAVALDFFMASPCLVVIRSQNMKTRSREESHKRQ